MKIVYCINAVSNSGGMERILQQKANYLADIVGYEVIIITTEQGNLRPFFPFSSKIRFIDLDVDYGDRADKPKKNIIWKVIWKNLHKPIHKRRLTKILIREKADVVVTLFNNDIGFLPSINDGSKKIAEFHFSYKYKLIESNNPMVKFVQLLRIIGWKRDVAKFDHFVVLTYEDAGLWGSLNNMKVIPNFLPILQNKHSACSQKRIIAVGRASYEKGFDRLLYAWDNVFKHYPDWELYIFGNGVKELLKDILNDRKLEGVYLEDATSEIFEEYLKSSLFVLPSRYEGFGLVIIEAMSCGLPVVSFDCPCGPKDIIRKEFGSLVPNGDIQGLANAMMKWMSDEDLRIKGGRAARIAVQQYAQDVIMKKWIELFES